MSWTGPFALAAGRGRFGPPRGNPLCAAWWRRSKCTRTNGVRYPDTVLKLNPFEGGSVMQLSAEN